MAEKLKSAFELAMERLQRQDRAEGVARSKPLTAAQKARIAELRQEAQAKRAELKILREKRFAAVAADPEKLREEEAHYETDLRRVETWLEEQLAAVRKGG
jgi:hypothetical protein